MSLTPNLIDGIIFFILFVFAFLAFLKGFIREFFSTLNLIIAITLSYTVAPYIAKLINISAPQILIDLVVQFVIFILTLIVCSIFSSKISHPLSDKIPNSLNQSLGFGFGFAKGYLILSFVFAIMLFFYSDKDSLEEKIKNSKYKAKFGPEWLTESRSYDILEYGANFLQPLVGKAFSQMQDETMPKNNTKNDSVDNLDKIIKGQKIYDQIKKSSNFGQEEEDNEDNIENIPEEPAQENNSGYTEQEIKKMKRLIEIMSN